MPLREVTEPRKRAATRQTNRHRADELKVRLALAREVAQIASARHLTQCQVAEILGTSQPKVSALFAGRVDGFSLDRLVRFLNLLGEEIHIVILPSADRSPIGITSVLRVAPPALEGG